MCVLFVLVVKTQSLFLSTFYKNEILNSCVELYKTLFFMLFLNPYLHFSSFLKKNLLLALLGLWISSGHFPNGHNLLRWHRQLTALPRPPDARRTAEQRQTREVAHDERTEGVRRPVVAADATGLLEVAADHVLHGGAREASTHHDARAHGWALLCHVQSAADHGGSGADEAHEVGHDESEQHGHVGVERKVDVLGVALLKHRPVVVHLHLSHLREVDIEDLEVRDDLHVVRQHHVLDDVIAHGRVPLHVAVRFRAEDHAWPSRGRDLLLGIVAAPVVVVVDEVLHDDGLHEPFGQTAALVRKIAADEREAFLVGDGHGLVETEGFDAHVGVNESCVG
eukprot:PhM_4_TR15951/c0_g1_i1/m.102786